MLDTHHEISAVWARRLGEVRADLLHLSDRWPDLYQLRLPGKARRRTPARLTPAAREAADELARTERAERGNEVLGASRAPMDIAVLDTLADLLADAVELADRIAATAGADEPEPPSTAYDFEALPRILAHASALLVPAADTDPEALDDAQETARTMRMRLDGALDEIADGQRLAALCAWCHGSTSEAPVGGERTLVVRIVVGEPVIVCESDVCEPPEADCGTWVRGRPGWPQWEWPWLANRLDVAVANGRIAS